MSKGTLLARPHTLDLSVMSRHDCVVKLESRNVLHLRETPHMYDTTLIFAA